jgi:hypothetical protein
MIAGGGHASFPEGKIEGGVVFDLSISRKIPEKRRLGLRAEDGVKRETFRGN